MHSIKEITPKNHCPNCKTHLGKDNNIFLLEDFYYLVCRKCDENIILEIHNGVTTLSKSNEHYDTIIMIDYYRTPCPVISLILDIKECNISDTAGFIYFLRVGDRVKIGRSKNPKRRIRELSGMLPSKYDSFRYYHSDEMAKKENELHRKCCKKRVNNEWFVLSKSEENYLIEDMFGGK